MTFFSHWKKKNLTWKFRKIYFNLEKDSEYYDLLTDENNTNFEFSFPLSEFHCLYSDVSSPTNRKYSVVASETWTPNGTLEVYHWHQFDNLWRNGKIVLKETDSEQPDQNDELTNLLDIALSPSASEQDKIAALKKAGEFEGLISSENQTKITQISQQLTNNLTQFRQALSEKIENQLTANNLTINDLPNDLNQNSETPWEKIILVSCIGIGLTLIILLVYNLTKNSRRR